MRYLRFISLFLLFLVTGCAQPQAPIETVAPAIEDQPQESPTPQSTATEPEPAFELEGRLFVADWSDSLNPYYIVHLPDLVAEPYEILNTENGPDRIDSVSPGGGFIAFTNVDLDEDPSADALLVLNTITGDLVEIGHFSLANNPPTWTADGGLLEFDSYDDGFYLYDPETDNLDHISTNSQYSDGSAISPDGDRIAYKGDCEATGCPDDLYIINTDGSGEQKLEDGAIQSIVWHPNGEQLYIVVREPAHNLYLYDIDSGVLTLIEEAIAYAGPSGVSPNGEFFAYASSGNHSVILKTSDNSLLPYEIQSTYLSWSPDSRFVAYSDESGFHFLELAMGDVMSLDPLPAGGGIQAWLP